MVVLTQRKEFLQQHRTTSEMGPFAILFFYERIRIWLRN